MMDVEKKLREIIDIAVDESKELTFEIFSRLIKRAYDLGKSETETELNEALELLERHKPIEKGVKRSLDLLLETEDFLKRHGRIA